MPEQELQRRWSIVETLKGSPHAAGLKRRVKDVVWAVRGLGYGNPPLPRNARSVLFVCVGNICRSPFAEQFARRLLAERGRPEVRCTSVGLSASPHSSPPLDAIEAARPYGIFLAGHRPVLITDELVNTHDVIVGMEPFHMDVLKRRWPELSARCFLLPLFDTEVGSGSYERYHLADPFGHGAPEFNRCYARTANAVLNLVAHWSSPRS